ncbi:MAG: leucine-rich repeat protein [Bacteroidaceae bacterium]|nr:leucine-rich repeat protein [Bacteroidaceae bacterium]
MKKLLFLISLMTCVLSGYSQKIAVHVEGEPLRSLLTEEQKQTMDTLCITGVLTKEDYAFLRNTEFKNLEVLDLSSSSIDTIPAKAFVGWDKGKEIKDLHSIFTVFRFILPETISFIGDSAFYNHQSRLELEIYGQFPEIGRHIAYVDFSDPYRGFVQWIIGEGNEKYIINNGIIGSSDGKTIFQTNEESYDICFSEGVSTIAGHAFEDCLLNQVILPESLDSIGNYAFHNLGIFPSIVRSTIYEGDYLFVCKAQIPPSLGEGALRINEEGMNFFTLYVPKESINLYRSTEGWSDFFSIESIDNLKEWVPHQVIAHEKTSSISHKIHTLASSLTCTSSDAVKIEVYSLDALKVGESHFANGQATIKVSHTPATYLYIVTYPDGKRESGKVRIN